jgi:hypothetical protein
MIIIDYLIYKTYRFSKIVHDYAPSTNACGIVGIAIGFNILSLLYYYDAFLLLSTQGGIIVSIVAVLTPFGVLSYYYRKSIRWRKLIRRFNNESPLLQWMGSLLIIIYLVLSLYVVVMVS